MADKNKKSYIRVSLLAAPLQAMLTTTPIFVLLGNDIRILPIIWALITLPILGLWIFNYTLQSKILAHWKYYLFSFAAVIFMTIATRHFFIDDFKVMLNGMGFGQIRQTPPLVTTTGLAVMNNAMVIVFQRLIRYREEQFRNLKNQVHPHFLFNSLNTLKILVRRNPELAESYIVNLSNFLRVAIQEDQNELISCAKDFDLATDYLSIQQIRFQDAIILEHDRRAIEEMGGMLPVLTLQSLFENAIKHNEISTEYPLQMKIYVEEGSLCVSNSRKPRKISLDQKSGSGLKNLHQRLLALGCGKLEIQSTDHLFIVKIKPKK